MMYLWQVALCCMLLICAALLGYAEEKPADSPVVGVLTLKHMPAAEFVDMSAPGHPLAEYIPKAATFTPLSGNRVLITVAAGTAPEKAREVVEQINSMVKLLDGEVEQILLEVTVVSYTPVEPPLDEQGKPLKGPRPDITVQAVDIPVGKDAAQGEEQQYIAGLKSGIYLMQNYACHKQVITRQMLIANGSAGLLELGNTADNSDYRGILIDQVQYHPDETVSLRAAPSSPARHRYWAGDGRRAAGKITHHNTPAQR